jgi:hypothetical protein
MFGIDKINTHQLVMPGLNPGIDQTFQQRFPWKMDCRVKPGNDNYAPAASTTCAKSCSRFFWVR